MEPTPHRHESGWTENQETQVEGAHKKLKKFFHPEHAKKLFDILGNPHYFDSATEEFLSPEGRVHIDGFISYLEDTRKTSARWTPIHDFKPEDPNKYFSPQYVLYWLEGRLQEQKD